MSAYLWAPAGLYGEWWHALPAGSGEPARSLCREVEWWGLTAEQLRLTPGGRPCLPCLLDATEDLLAAPPEGGALS